MTLRLRPLEQIWSLYKDGERAGSARTWQEEEVGVPSPDRPPHNTDLPCLRSFSLVRQGAGEWVCWVSVFLSVLRSEKLPVEHQGSRLGVSPRLIWLAGFSWKVPVRLFFPGMAEATKSRETG